MILAHAGNRLDAPGRVPHRFPEAHVPSVRHRLERLLKELAPASVVTAAASGADLILLDAAQKMSIATHVVLPSPPADFRASSVADQGALWARRFDHVMQVATTITVDDTRHTEEPYLAGNASILAKAAAIASENDDVVTALVVRPAPNGSAPSVTDDFALRATRLGYALISVDPSTTDHERR